MTEIASAVIVPVQKLDTMDIHCNDCKEIQSKLDQKTEENEILLQHICALEERLSGLTGLFEDWVKSDKEDVTKQRQINQDKKVSGTTKTSKEMLLEIDSLDPSPEDELDYEGRQAKAREIAAEQKKRNKWRKTGMKTLSLDNRDVF